MFSYPKTEMVAKHRRTRETVSVASCSGHIRIVQWKTHGRCSAAGIQWPFYRYRTDLALCLNEEAEVATDVNETVEPLQSLTFSCSRNQLRE